MLDYGIFIAQNIVTPIRMEKSKLTVIITFLNEGEEIENTLKSLRKFDKHDVDILLINDCSKDGVNYQDIAKKYNASYHFNEKRLGVAASRDLGISICNTPYFLLLDGHMRFYNDVWHDSIISELEQDNRVILCCQTKYLYKENNQVKTSAYATVPEGAYIDIDSLQPIWLELQYIENKKVVEIPCILGAAYACSKSYWTYLKGLKGLNSYGGDEAYISLKVWLEGGKCKLLKHVCIGHIYRKDRPYNAPMNDYVYNNLLISDFLLPLALKKHSYQNITKYKYFYEKAIHKLLLNKKEFVELHKYYHHILKESKSAIWKYNPKLTIIPTNVDQILENIAYTILSKTSSIYDYGLYNGIMGGIIFLCHYSHFTKNDFYDEFAYQTLQVLVQNIIFTKLPINLAYGVVGIGWAIQYLQHNDLMEKDEDILRNFDNKIMELNPENIKDWSFDTGLSGIIFYVLSRFSVNKSAILFSNKYINSLLKCCKRQLKRTDTIQGSYIATAFIEFIENEFINDNYMDIWEFINPNFDKSMEKMQEIGLYGGMTGLGIFYIYRLENKI